MAEINKNEVKELESVGSCVDESQPRVRIGPEERVWKPQKLNRVIILGMGASIWDWIYHCYAGEVLWDEPGTEIWAVNHAAYALRCHKIFNMHDMDENFDNRYNIYKLLDIPVISIKSYDWLPNSWEYPLHEVLEDRVAQVPYFTNGVSYLIALALTCRVDEMRLYGCDYDYDNTDPSAPTQYEPERANVEWWLGRAMTRTKVVIAPSSRLMNNRAVAKNCGVIPFYGYGAYAPEVIPGWPTFNFNGFSRPVPKNVVTLVPDDPNQMVDGEEVRMEAAE